VKKNNALELRSYPAPWKGELLLVCTKCTRKLKKDHRRFTNVRKWFKKRAKDAQDPPVFRIIGVNCVKMCPKDAITVATRHQLAHTPAQVSIIRSEADLKLLYEQLTNHSAA